MSFTSYSQNFEDVLLWRALRHVESGRYLDIGAQDPIIDSVSKSFHLAGWKGIHVEPTPDYAAALRVDRPDDIVIQAAIGEDCDAIAFYEIPETGLSTGVSEIAHRHAEHGYDIREIEVPVLPLSRLLQQVGPGDIHWMKIDVEGMEPTVLRSWHDHPARPWIVLVESTYPNTQLPTHDKWIDLILDRGYHEVHFDGLSRYFVADSCRELDAAFGSPPNIFDGFNVAAHHFSARAIHADQAAVLAELSGVAQASEARMREAEGGQKLLLCQLRDEQETRQRDMQDFQEVLASQRERAALQIGSLEASLSELRQAAKDSRQGERASLKARDGALAIAQKLADQIAQLKAERRTTERAIRRAARRLSTLLADEQAKSNEQGAQIERLLGQSARHEERAAKLGAQLAELTREFEADRQAGCDREAQLQRENGELIQRLSSAVSKIAACDELIERALAEPNSRWQRLGWALGLAGPDLAKKVLLQRNHPLSSPVYEGLELVTVNLDAQHERNPYHGANSLAELLEWHDLDFVRCAYATILGRRPDANGEAYYLDRIRRGRSKMELLWQLRTSAEGRNFTHGIVGLDRCLRRARRLRWPVVGPIFGLWTSEGDEGGTSASARAIANATWLNLRGQKSILEQLERQSGALRQELLETSVQGFDKKRPLSSPVNRHLTIEQLMDLDLVGI